MQLKTIHIFLWTTSFTLDKGIIHGVRWYLSHAVDFWSLLARGTFNNWRNGNPLKAFDQYGTCHSRMVFEEANRLKGRTLRLLRRILIMRDETLLPRYLRDREIQTVKGWRAMPPDTFFERIARVFPHFSPSYWAMAQVSTVRANQTDCTTR